MAYMYTGGVEQSNFIEQLFPSAKVILNILVTKI